MQKNALHILKSPRITEKGAYMSEQGVYVFNVTPEATKTDIKAAIKEVYNVIPRKVTVSRIVRKEVNTRNTNRKGMTRGGKKAFVFLKKGETIEII